MKITQSIYILGSLKSQQIKTPLLGILVDFMYQGGLRQKCRLFKTKDVCENLQISLNQQGEMFFLFPLILGYIFFFNQNHNNVNTFNN